MGMATYFCCSFDVVDVAADETWLLLLRVGVGHDLCVGTCLEQLCESMAVIDGG